ncbi:sugar transferase [Candidatus Poribacteria bacterium]|nr:sugar transferase [Candidatus Poribacteria bacterium]
MAGFAAAWWLAYEFRALLNPWMGPINTFAPYRQIFALVVATGLVNCALFGLYVVRRRLSSLNSWEALLKAGYHYVLYMMVLGYFFKELDLGRSVILLFGVLALVYLYASRTAMRRLKAAAIRAGSGRVRAAVVGTGRLAHDVIESMQTHPEIGFEVVGVVRHPLHPGDDGDFRGLPVLGETGGIADLVRQHGIEEIFVAIPHLSPTEQLNVINLSEVPGLRIQLVSNLFGVITSRAKVDEIAAFPVVTLRDGHLPWPQAAAKRLLDIAVSAIGLLLWLLLVHWWVALWIRRDSPGPVFFKQTRVGHDGKTFEIFKYRTMRTDAEKYAVAPSEEDDPRITRAGRWLRKTSLDEFPQLLNVLRGEMSMVGPRPEMPFIVESYEDWQRRRLDVKPGITGLWQVIGRKNLPLHLNMEYDFYYIMNQSLLLDIEILIRTVPAVLKGRGAF